MRLITRDTKEFPLKRAVTAASSYGFGTENQYEPVGTVRGLISPVRDSFAVELYGARAEAMFRFVTEAGTDIRKNDRVTLPDGDYRVVSIAEYVTHTEATLEKAGAYNGNN